MMDYVLPYVDNTDPVWRDAYRAANNCMTMDESRFRPFDTLKFAFRSIENNMPFIDRIVLLVSTVSQVPEWVNRERVRIVTHDEFMPAAHRPTFNSSSIESDMWRIDGLTDLFVYGNDDFFALRPMTEGDFFDGDKPRLNFAESDFRVQNVFRRCCRNGMDMAADAAGAQRTDFWTLLKPQHCMKGIAVRHMKEIGRKCESLINKTITIQRNRNNVTGYIYHYFALYKDEYAPFGKTYEYIRIDNKYEKVVELINTSKADMLCINDAGDLDGDHYADACDALKDAFTGLFPERSCYELP